MNSSTFTLMFLIVQIIFCAYSWRDMMRYHRRYMKLLSLDFGKYFDFYSEYRIRFPEHSHDLAKARASMLLLDDLKPIELESFWKKKQK